MKLKASGKVREIGVSNFNVDQLERIRSIAPIGSLQPPYSLVRREIEQDVLPSMGTPKDAAQRNRDFLRSIGV